MGREKEGDWKEEERGGGRKGRGRNREWEGKI